MFEAVASWLEAHREIAVGVVLGSVLIMAAATIALPWIIAALPQDYFAGQPFGRSKGLRSHPAVYWTVWVLRNVLGVVFVGLGIAMLVLPGQGLLTIAVGVMLLQFPGKRWLEVWFVHRRGVWRALNWVRRKMHKPEFDEGRTSSRDEM